MKNAYMRRRVKARVEKSARMKKLDAITLDFARRVIEEETGASLDIQAPSAEVTRARAAQAAKSDAGAGSDPKLIARDERKNPLISIFEWTNDAAQRILRVPAGFMRNQVQERVEELARERAAASIDLALVEEGIELGKQMMAAMISTYSSSGASPGVAATTQASAGASAVTSSAPPVEASSAARDVSPAVNGSGYLNEVGARPAMESGRGAQGEAPREAVSDDRTPRQV